MPHEKTVPLAQLAPQKLITQQADALNHALARYASEPVDAAWASAKEAKLLAASVSDEIRRVDAVPWNYRARCHSSVCRISVSATRRP